jgi:hypothetical protein
MLAMQGFFIAPQKRRISSSLSGASKKMMSAPSASKSWQRASASSKPCTARASVRAMIRMSASARASTAARIFIRASSRVTTCLPLVWPHFFGLT